MLQMLKHYITFWNSDIDNIHDITRPNIGISILQPITLDADLRKANL
jgi:hypothetical protein